MLYSPTPTLTPATYAMTPTQPPPLASLPPLASGIPLLALSTGMHHTKCGYGYLDIGMYEEAYIHRYKYMVRHIRMTSLPSYPPSCTLLPSSLDVGFTHHALNLHLPNYRGYDLGQPPSPSIYSLRPTNFFFRARQGRLLVLILVRWVSLFLLCALFCFYGI